MIAKRNNKYQVLSSRGKPLSKPNLSKEQALKRLRQVEFFKHLKK